MADQHSAGSTSSRKQPDPICLPKMNPFFQNLAIYRGMAKTLNTDADVRMALSSMESGWLNPHNQGLHNLFGVTQAGADNLSFSTYRAAAEYWTKHFGPYVNDANSMRDFADGLRRAKYNTANPDYYVNLRKQYSSVLKFKTACGVK